MTGIAVLRRPLLALACAIAAASAGCGGGGGAANGVEASANADRSASAGTTAIATAAGGASATASPATAVAPVRRAFARATTAANGTPTDTVTLSGTIDAPSDTTIDSDTNNPDQPNRLPNDSLGSAQPLGNPGQALGYVNRAGAGADGVSVDSGDPWDLFRLPVAAGQAVVLEFAGTTGADDLDLYALADDGTLLAYSIAAGSGRECVTFGAARDAVIAINAWTGAAAYRLRVVAASEADCGTVAAAALPVLADRVIAAPATTPAAKQLLAGVGLSVARAASDAGPWLVTLPATPAGRGAVLKALDATVASPAGAVRKSVVEPPAAPAGVPGTSVAALQTLAVAKRLAATGRFAYAEADRVVRTDAADVGTLPSNDPDYVLQRWQFDAIGLPAAAARLAERVPSPTGNPVVAIVDTGVVLDHPELAPMFVRRADGSVEGWDFVSTAEEALDGDGPDPDPDDVRQRPANVTAYFHGTHVAGTIAAQSFNAAGIAGVAPMARLMPVRVLGPVSGSTYDVIQGVLFAAGLPNDSGALPVRVADVINLSLGTSGSCPEALQDAITRARAQGSLVVAAAGNAGHNELGVPGALGAPANCSGVIAVGAIGNGGTLASYSSSGARLALLAPGGDGDGSDAAGGSVWSTRASFDAQGLRVPGYGAMVGTSMATPHVSAVLALMRWVAPDVKPLTIDLLLATGRLSRGEQGDLFDTLRGRGVIAADKAVDEAIRTLTDRTPIRGTLEVLPGLLEFGATLERRSFEIRATAPTDEQVVAIEPAHPALRIAPRPLAVTSSGRGIYDAAVDRSALLEPLATTIAVRLGSGRTITLPVRVEPWARDASGARAGSVGTLYVQALDADSGEALVEQRVEPSAGRYRFALVVPRGSRLSLVAGNDPDNDFLMCTALQACGRLPAAGALPSELQADADLSGLDFPLAILPAGTVP